MSVPSISVGQTVGPADAPLLVLGCSLGTAEVLWEQALPLLQQNFRVSVWELPGHGASRPATEGFDVADLADAVAGSYEGTFLYAGVSIGGAVGLELALRHSDRVGAIASVCSGARLGTREGWEERRDQVRAQGTASLVTASAERWFAPGTIAAQPELTGRLLHALRDADDESYALCCEALARFDARSRLGEIELPVLALWGEFDAVTPAAKSEEIAAGVRRGVARRVDGASHLAVADAPLATAQLLQEFFTQVLAKGAP